MKSAPLRAVVLSVCAFTVTVLLGRPQSPDQSTGPAEVRIGKKAFADYFFPLKNHGPLALAIWGASTVGPRDTSNGLEDTTMKQWDYWDGSVLKGPDGRYRMFASRWSQADGHQGWLRSKAVEAVSSSLYGPYKDMGLLWPTNLEGKGHNVTALRLPDGSYAVVISETRNGDVFTSKSIDGPWTYLGPLRADQTKFHSLGNAKGGDPPLRGGVAKPWHGSNVDIIVRPDGRFMMVQRSGQILISDSGILGPYVVQGDSVYRGLAGLPQEHLERYEDPVLWNSGGWYHIIVNEWGARKAYHLISRDGVTKWRFQGIAFQEGTDFIKYADGQVNRWNKLERPGVVLERGHVVAVTLAVIDVPKEDERGNDGHGSKVVVLPFDGAAMDRDLADK